MNFQTLESILKRRNLKYTLQKNNDKSFLNSFSNKISLPDEVYSFYFEYDYLIIEKPHIEIYPLNKLFYSNENHLVFCCINKKIELAFDTSIINNANQWNIVNINNDYVVTLTMASFCSNKIINWIDKGREIWHEDLKNTCKYK